MHNNFSEWYRLVALEPDGTKLAKRWAGVKAWTTAARGGKGSRGNADTSGRRQR